MTTVSLDFRSVLGASPFNGIVKLAPRNNGITGCSLYVASPVEVTLNYTGGTYAPKEVELTPSSLVGAYNLMLLTNYRKLVYQSTIVVPDSGEHCVSSLVGSEDYTVPSIYVTHAELEEALENGGGATNLTFTRNSTTVTVESDTGTDAVLPAATTSLAGVMIAADKTKLDGIEVGATAFNPATPGPIGSTTPSTGVFTELDITSALPGALEVTGGASVGGPFSITNWRSYASDAAAIADAALPVGAIYVLNANPAVVRRKV